MLVGPGRSTSATHDSMSHVHAQRLPGKLGQVRLPASVNFVAGVPLTFTIDTVFKALHVADKYDCPVARQEGVEWLASYLIQLSESQTTLG